MRLAFVTPEYVTPAGCDGGLANYLKKTAAALASRGCDVSIIVASDRDAEWHDGAVNVWEVRRTNRILELAMRAPFVSSAVAFANQLESARALARRVWMEHRKRAFDLVQASSYMAPGSRLLGNGRFPVVCRVSSYTPLLRAAYGRPTGVGQRMGDWLEARQVRRADAAFAPSRFIAQAYARAIGREPALLRTPLEVSAIVPDPSYYTAHRPAGRYLLCFGTASRIKGFDLLAPILPRLFDAHPDLSIVFIGRDDGLPDGTKVFDFLRAHAPAHADRLHHHPALAKARLVPFIEHAEAVVMPSRVDNYPNACLEAQMFGIPVIGTYDSSLDEMIDDGATGFLAKNGDAAAVATAIERCLAMAPHEREAMKRRILESIEQIRREDRIGELLAFYEATIQRFRTSHD